MTKNVFLITDPNSDPDDLMALILLSRLAKEDKINICGVVAAKGSAGIRLKRAQFAKAALNVLKMGDVPVCVGGEYEKTKKLSLGDDCFCNSENVKKLLNFADSVKGNSLSFSKEIFEKYDNITVLIISPMNDFSDFIKSFSNLAKEKISQIVIMVGLNEDKIGRAHV